MVCSPDWWVYQCWQEGKNICFCVIYFSGGCAWGYVMCTFVANQHYSCRTIQVFEWLHIRKTELIILCWYMHGWRGCHDWMAFWLHYSGQRGCFWMWDDVSSVWTVSSVEKYWLAEICHLSLTVFCWMQLKLSAILKYMPLTPICLHSSVRRWTQGTHVFSCTQKWDGFLKEDHWPEFLSYKTCSTDFL